jgi:fucose 4-O-acetylase-like acetyltransferase
MSSLEFQKDRKSTLLEVDGGSPESGASLHRLRAITYASAIGIAVVVFFHSHHQSADIKSVGLDRLISSLQAFASSFQMPLFFAISGFLYAYTNKPGRHRTYLELLRGKMARLLLPYVVISTFVYPIKCFLSRFAIRPLSMGWRPYVESLLIPDKNPVAFFWFLPTLFCIFLVAPVLLACFRLKTKAPAWCLKVLVTALLIGVRLNCHNVLGRIPNVLSIQNALTDLLFFWAGMWICYSRENIFIGLSKPVRNGAGMPTARTLIAAAMILMTFHICLFNFDAFASAPARKVIMAFLGIGETCCCALALGNRDIRLLNTLGLYSYQIYLLSWFFQVPIQIVNIHFLPGIPVLISTSISFLVGIVGPLLCVWLVLSFVPRIKPLIGL